MKASAAVVRVLKAEGVEFITGFPSNPLFEAAAKEGIRPIKARTERVAVNIADGYTRATMGKRIGVCATQYGPGIENAFAGVAQAYADSVPILVLPSGYARRELVPPQFSAARNYREVTKWAEYIGLAERVPGLMRRAFTNLRTGRPGPVMLELPIDVAEEECSDALCEYRAVQATRSAGDPADVKYVARALISAARPVSHTSGAGDPVRRGLGRTERARRTLGHPGFHLHEWEECLPRESFAVAGNWWQDTPQSCNGVPGQG